MEERCGLTKHHRSGLADPMQPNPTSDPEAGLTRHMQLPGPMQTLFADMAARRNHYWLNPKACAATVKAKLTLNNAASENAKLTFNENAASVNAKLTFLKNAASVN